MHLNPRVSGFFGAPTLRSKSTVLCILPHEKHESLFTLRSFIRQRWLLRPKFGTAAVHRMLHLCQYRFCLSLLTPFVTDPTKRRPTVDGNSNLKSFKDFVPPNAIISPPPSPTKRSIFTSNTSQSGTSTSARLRDAFLKVKAMKSASSKMLAPAFERNKSPSPNPPPSKSRRSVTPPPLPTRERKAYLQKSRDEESTRLLRRSNTVATHSSTDSSASHSYPPLPSRTSSRASRISSMSTTSTITPQALPRRV